MKFSQPVHYPYIGGMGQASAQKSRPLEPEHPGLAIKFKLDRFHEESKLPRLSIAAYAKELNVSASALGRLFNGKASLTAHMALKLEKAFDMDAHALLRDQYSYDLVRAQNRMAAEDAMARYGHI